MEYVRLTKDNIESEHICCAISNNKDPQVASKKAWLTERFDDGLEFIKADARGKCFIEYLPAEAAWVPIEADGYYYINCFWVSGKLKGQGYSSDLLDACIKEAREQEKKGLVILSSDKKRPFLADPKYLSYKGFLVADQAAPYFELRYLPLKEGVEVPQFKENIKNPQITQRGYVLYYSSQCPFTAKYVPLLEQIAIEQQIPFQAVKFQRAEQAQNGPTPFSTFSLFYNGTFVTHEILSPAKYLKIIQG
ncbi:GCN5-related N-acetyltransferase [Lachnospiraceae bacterium KM106-2]|nr:GCN5-related N-acetyltransferase [Lachnospiraceae bacterium KM106-2]